MHSTHVSPSPSWKALVPQSPPPLHRSAYPQILYLPTCPPTPNRLTFLTLLIGLCFHSSQQSISDELQSIVGRCIDLPDIQPSSSPSSFSRSLQGFERTRLLCVFASDHWNGLIWASHKESCYFKTAIREPFTTFHNGLHFLEDSVWKCPNSETDAFVIKHT